MFYIIQFHEHQNVFSRFASKHVTLKYIKKNNKIGGQRGIFPMLGLIYITMMLQVSPAVMFNHDLTF